jgi:hypothetical protein
MDEIPSHLHDNEASNLSVGMFAHSYNSKRVVIGCNVSSRTCSFAIEHGEYSAKSEEVARFGSGPHEVTYALSARFDFNVIKYHVLESSAPPSVSYHPLLGVPAMKFGCRRRTS